MLAGDAADSRSANRSNIAIVMVMVIVIVIVVVVVVIVIVIVVGSNRLKQNRLKAELCPARIKLQG